MMEQTLRVAMATDENYVCFTGISLYSLLDNNRDFTSIEIYILDTGIQERGKKQLQDIVTAFDRHIAFLDCSDIGKWLGEEIAEMFRSEKTNVPIASYARLFLPNLLPDTVEKILYLDVDSLVVGSYLSLWQIDVESYSVMGVRDNVSGEAKRRVGLSDEYPYVNAGVLLMNIKRMRDENFAEKALAFIRLYHGRVYHHDQGVMNGVLCDSMGYLAPEYNMMAFAFEAKTASQVKKRYGMPSYYSEQEFQNAKAHPVFVHFTEGNLQRPWVEHCKHPLKDKWLYYRDQTVWKDMPLKPDTRSAKLKLLAWMNRNLPVKVTKALLSLVSK